MILQSQVPPVGLGRTRVPPVGLDAVRIIDERIELENKGKTMRLVAGAGDKSRRPGRWQRHERQWFVYDLITARSSYKTAAGHFPSTGFYF